MALGPPMVVVAVAATLALAALVLATALAGPAGAQATFTVDRSDDPDPPVGACTPAPNDCSLRGAIITANTAPGEDTIEFSVNRVDLSIPGQGEDAAATGDLDILEDLIIDGGGVLIVANDIDRVFDIFGPATATISNLTVEDGQETSGEGGGIFVRSGATLELSGSTLKRNITEESSGGGIFVDDDGTANVTTTTFKSNFADGFGGGIAVDEDGTANITTTTFDGNHAEGDSGGIDSEGTLSVKRTTFTANVADSDQDGDGFGGGLSVFGGTATVTNTTFSANTTFGIPDEGSDDSGGGVAVTEGTLSLTNVTIANNRAPRSFGGGISNTTGDPAAIEAKNTIVANNTQESNGQCGGDGVTSEDGNLEFPGTSCGFEVNADPDLRPLADYGGPTQTRLPNSGSPAIDAGEDAGCPANDQRGVARPQDGDENGSAICDIGAVEFDPPLDFCTIRGTNGDDNLAGTAGRDVICGLAGEDEINGFGGEDTILGNAGNDLLSGGTDTDTIRGAEGADKIFGGDAGGDDLFGNAGADRMSGEGGEDDLTGGAGNDTQRGGNGDDLLRGQVGKDVLVSGTGVDDLFGGTENDKLNVRDGSPGDLADGGTGGNDRCASDSGDTERRCEGQLAQAALQR